jgi:hypothetical protein
LPEIGEIVNVLIHNESRSSHRRVPVEKLPEQLRHVHLRKYPDQVPQSLRRYYKWERVSYEAGAYAK